MPYHTIPQMLLAKGIGLSELELETLKAPQLGAICQQQVGFGA